MARGIVPGLNEVGVRLDPLIDYEDKLVSGYLTGDGIQYSQEVTTGEAGVDTVIFQKLIEAVIEGEIIWVEFDLDAELRAVSSSTADLTWKWQVRNKDGTWVDLHQAVIETNIGISYQGRHRSGYLTPQANFDSVPFEVRLLLQCNEANQGRARVKNTSYVRVVFRTI